jgi:hypothetical protein
MKSIGEIKPALEKSTSRKTERGELMRFFCRHLNYSRKQDGHKEIAMARMGFILEKIPTGDLYYLQSVCAKAKNFSKRFWWEIDPKKHLPENNQPF